MKPKQLNNSSKNKTNNLLELTSVYSNKLYYFTDKI